MNFTFTRIRAVKVKSMRPNLGRKCFLINSDKQNRAGSHLENDGEQEDGDEHEEEAVDEPGHPVDPVAEAHHLHRLLQPLLLLVHDGLDDHGAGVHPRQGHEQRERSRDGHDELKNGFLVKYGSRRPKDWQPRQPKPSYLIPVGFCSTLEVQDILMIGGFNSPIARRC